MIDAIKPISTIIVVFAVLLNALVIYNLTNINIDERVREIATLKVLGYANGEVAGYIFREVFLLSALGILIGLPTGYLLMHFMFTFLKFGGVEFVEWYVWLISCALSLVSIALADVLLFRKIRKVDMNSSLKIME
jgi:putative ABC transport system permease protein